MVGGDSELLSIREVTSHRFPISYTVYSHSHLLRCWLDLAGSWPRSLSSLVPHRLLVLRCLLGPWCWWPWPGDPGWGRVPWADVRGRGEARCTSCSNISAEETESRLRLVAGPSSLLMLSVSELRRIGDRRLAPSDERSETQAMVSWYQSHMSHSRHKLYTWVTRGPSWIRVLGRNYIDNVFGKLNIGLANDEAGVLSIDHVLGFVFFIWFIQSFPFPTVDTRKRSH